MKRIVCVRTLGLAVATVFIASTVAQPRVHAKDDRARYAMERTEDGMLRLDRKTGAVSLCRSRDGAWACARIEDDSAGLEAEIVDLKADNRKLRERIASLESQLNSGHGADKGKREQRNRALPSDEDVDRAFSFLEGVIKRFKGMVEDIREDRESGTPL